MCPDISPASGAPVCAISDLMTLCPVRVITGLPPSAAMRSNRCRLAFTSAITVAPGMRAQHRFGQDRQDLVAPHHAAPPVHRTDPVAIAVEGQSEIEPLVRDQPFQVAKVRFHGGVGMHGWENDRRLSVNSR